MQHISGTNKFPYARRHEQTLWVQNLIHLYIARAAESPLPHCEAYCKVDLADNAAGQMGNAINCRKWLAQ